MKWLDYSNSPADAAANTASLNTFLSVCAANGEMAVLPANAGNIPFSDEITIPNNGGLIAEVPASVTLDFSGATSGTFSNSACIFASGTFSALPALTTDLSSNGATQAVLASAPSPALAKGDVIFIVDKGTLFNPARTYYYEGEAVKIDSQAGAAITFQTPLYSTYSAATSKLNKMIGVRVVLEGLNVIGPSNKAITCISIVAGRNVTLRNCSANNTNYTGIELTYCIDSEIVDCTGGKLVADGGAGESYGLAIGNSQNIRVRGGYYISARHGLTMGGLDSDQSIICRFIEVSDAYIAHWAQSDTNIWAADMHGNTQYCGYVNCFIDGGIVVSGDRNFVLNGVIRSGPFFGTNSPPSCVEFSELRSLNHVITPDHIDARGINTANNDYGLVFDLGWPGDGLNTDTIEGGTLVFHPRRVTYKPSKKGVAGHQSLISIQNNGSTVRNRIQIGGDWICTGLDGCDYVMASCRSLSGSDLDMLDLSALRGDMPWTISNVKNVVLDGADLNQTGLTATGYTPPFNTGYPIFIYNCANVSAIGLKLRGGDGVGLELEDCISVDLSGLTASGYSGLAIDIINCTYVKIAPGDLSGLGVNINTATTVRYTPGVNDGTVTNSSVTNWHVAQFS